MMGESGDWLRPVMAGVVLSGVLTAAKAEPSATSAYPVPPTVDWSGVYVGATVGYGTLQGFADVDAFLLGDLSRKVDREAGYVSGTVGADMTLWDRWLVGGFAEYGASNYTHASLTQWNVGGRLGYLAWDHLLLFVSGGYSEMKISDQSLMDVGIDDRLVNALVDGKIKFPTFQGRFVGGGVEAMLTDGLSLRGEYRYDVFNEKPLDFNALKLPSVVEFFGFGASDFASAKVKPETHIFRLTLAYKFGLGR